MWTGAAIATAAAVLLPSTAEAQGFNSKLRIDQLQPATAFSPFTRAEGPHHEFEDGVEFAARLALDYQLDPLVARVVTTETGEPVFADASIVQHALLLHLGAALSPIDWLNVEFNMPIAMFEDGSRALDHTGLPPGDALMDSQNLPAGEAGIGDGRVGVLFRPVISDPFDLSMGLRFWAPWGSSSAYMGYEEFPRFEAVVATAGEYESLLWGCTIGVGPLLFAGRDGDRAALSCAGHFDATTFLSFGVEPHVAMYTYAAQDKRGSQAPGFGEADDPSLPGSSLAVQFEPLGAVRFHFSGVHVGVAAGPGLGGAPGTPTFRGVLTVGYSALSEPVVDEKGPRDSDLDGLPDAYDKCPDEAGPEERDGCPEAQDVDGDGIVEGDACPTEPGARYEDPDANGCPDRDNDHIADPVDPCPKEPGARSGGCPRYARLAGMDEPKRLRFRINPPIAFKKGSAELQPKAVEALREIVATMRANPKLEQVSLTVGAKKASQKLTDDRAKAILVVFGEDQDFDTNRYEVVIGEDLMSGKVRVRIIQ